MVYPKDKIQWSILLELSVIFLLELSDPAFQNCWFITMVSEDKNLNDHDIKVLTQW